MDDSLPAGRSAIVRAAVGVAAVYLVIVEPLWLALELQGALPRLAAYGAPAWLLALGRGIVAMLGLTAGRALWSGQPGAPALGCAWAIGAMAVLALTAVTPYFPANRPPSTKALLLTFWFAVYGASALAFGLAAATGRRR